MNVGIQNIGATYKSLDIREASVHCLGIFRIQAVPRGLANIIFHWKITIITSVRLN